MRTKNIQQIIVIQESDPTLFQQQVNDTLKTIDDVEEIATATEGNDLRCIIRYNEHVDEPEDISDKYRLTNGQYRFCCDCPDLVPDADPRSVTHWCRFHKDRFRMDAPACEEFYAKLMSGEAHVASHEERKAATMKELQEVIDLRKERKRIAQAESVLKSAVAREARKRATWYMIEWPGNCPEEYRPIENQSLHLDEFSLYVKTISKNITEKDLIRLAKDTGADALWRDTVTDRFLVNLLRSDNPW